MTLRRAWYGYRHVRSYRFLFCRTNAWENYIFSRHRLCLRMGRPPNAGHWAGCWGLHRLHWCNVFVAPSGTVWHFEEMLVLLRKEEQDARVHPCLLGLS